MAALDNRPRVLPEIAIRARGRRNQNKRVIAVTAAAGIVAAGIGGAAYYNAPGTVLKRSETPAMVQLAKAGDYHNYDRVAFENYKGLKSVSPVVLKHWSAITNIAGDRYNTFAVLDTLSRTPSSANEADTSIKINQWAGTDRTGRRADIIRRASALPNADALFKDMFNLPSRKIEAAREVFYGNKVWEYGKLRSGAHTNAPAFKPAQKGQSYKTPQKYQGMKAKSLQAQLMQPRQHRRV
jgi:hypothetical protein